MEYTILKNWHYSIFNPFKHRWVKLNCKEVRFKFILPKSAWYAKENEDDSDWNKLYGISYGIFGIHKNSLRIVWRPDFKTPYRFEIGYYAYENEVRVVKKLCSVWSTCQHEAQILLHEDNNVSVFVDGDYRYFEKCNVKTKLLGFTCKPYHGGDNKAKNKYEITII